MLQQHMHGSSNCNSKLGKTAINTRREIKKETAINWLQLDWQQQQ